MSKKIFTESDIIILRSNKYVKNVSNKSITYNNEFKLHFIAEYEKGVMPSVIFKEAGFDTEMLGKERIKTASFRWRRAYKENDVMGLEDTRRLNSGRPRSKEHSLEEIVEKQKAEIEYLKAEVELLKKLELRERQVKKGKLIQSQVFKIIERIIAKHNLKKVVKHLCKISGVSTSGYYHYLSTRDIRSNRHQQDQEDFELISKAYRLKGYNKGSRGIYMTLKNVFGVINNRKKIQRLMRKFGLVCPIRKTNPYKRMAKATKEHRVVPNILNRDFKKGKPGQILLTDITYIPFKDRFAYLSVIKDSVTNEVLAHYLSNNIKLEIATKTIEILLEKHKKRLKTDAYVHSDQGVHV